MTVGSPDDADAPLLDAWRRFVDGDVVPFAVPGHKRRAGSVWPTLGRLLDGDVPLYGGLDAIKNAAGRLAGAEALGAQLWGADWCRYSTGGSTQANQTVALAIGEPGATVLVSRAAHRSTLSGLILAGLVPVWLPTDVDSALGFPVGVAPRALAAALADHPDAIGVICVEPSYVGTLSDLPQIVRLAHDRDVPVIVDQAWAGHFGFHPAYPAHALQAGADAMIISAHKALPAYSQASLVLARTERLDRARLDRAFDTLATTSPAGSILASIDASRALLASPAGRHLLQRLLGLVADARGELRAAGLTAPDTASFAPGRFDPAKLVVTFAANDGLAVERALIAGQVPVEYADRDCLVAIVTMVDDEASVGRLVRTIVDAVTAARCQPRGQVGSSVWTPQAAPQVLTPRDAFFAEHTTVPATQAIGRVSAELVAPYPPGVPLLVPGELITSEVTDALHAARAGGVRIAYAADPTLRSYQVVADETRPSTVTMEKPR